MLLRLARQVRLLHDEVDDALAHGGAGTVDLPLAVNADSLATWFRRVLREVATWGDVALRDTSRPGVLHRAAAQRRRADRGHQRADGRQGARSNGSARCATCRPPPGARRAVAARPRPDWAAMPVVVFNGRTAAARRAGRARVGEPPVVHRVPDLGRLRRRRSGSASAGHDPRTAARRRARPLVGRLHVDVDLHWQRWRLDSPVLDRLTGSYGARRARLRA